MAALAANDPEIAKSYTGDENSFAYPTARLRWPKILDQAVDEITSTLSQYDGLLEVDVHAARHIQSKIISLKSSMANNATLAPLPDDGGLDIKQYNEELQALRRPSWLAGPWLFLETYLYRLLHTFFSMPTPFWQEFDMFLTSKRQSLVGSQTATVELVKIFRSILKAIAEKKAEDEETQKAVFEEILDISLWGNATDLSLLTSGSMEELQSRQGKAAREKSKENILVNDTDQVWKLLSSIKSSDSAGPIHIVLDNAGFELLTDLVLAGYLIESGHASSIVLHGKCMPWFVSDVNPRDLTDLIQGFAKGTTYFDIDSADKHEIQEAGKYWQLLMESGKMRLEAHPFWTTQHPFGRMPQVEPKLFDQLTGADLVIAKGDLNYRKLVYDGMWPHTTSFREALGPLAEKHDGKGIRSLALRTAKADVAVGLKPGVEEKLPNDWTRTGRYAMISYWDAKS